MVFPIGLVSGKLGDMRLVEKLEMALRSKGLTQGSFERLAMLSENRISKWKNNQGEPTVRQALRMARLLDLPLDYLADDEVDEEPHRLIDDWERKIRDVIAIIGAEVVYRRLLESLKDVSGDGPSGFGRPIAVVKTTLRGAALAPVASREDPVVGKK
jgi:transcriptional regulator with XRE-family HTH domain